MKPLEMVFLARNQWNLRDRVRVASNVTRPGVNIANLQDSRDAGTRAAIAQMKRKMRQF